MPPACTSWRRTRPRALPAKSGIRSARTGPDRGVPSCDCVIVTVDFVPFPRSPGGIRPQLSGARAQAGRSPAPGNEVNCDA